MNICYRCEKETNSTYLSHNYASFTILCGKCAKEFEKETIVYLENRIIEIQNRIGSIKGNIQKAIQADCEHTFEIYNWSIHDDCVVYMCEKCQYKKNRQSN